MHTNLVVSRDVIFSLFEQLLLLRQSRRHRLGLGLRDLCFAIGLELALTPAGT